MKRLALAQAAILLSLAAIEATPVKAKEPVKIPRSMRCTFDYSWEDKHPNDDWRGKGNKKRRFK
jgi:hypothetical protein